MLRVCIVAHVARCGMYHAHALIISCVHVDPHTCFPGGPAGVWTARDHHTPASHTGGPIEFEGVLMLRRTR